MDFHLARQPRPTLLPHALALLYGFAIVYASLQPFGEFIPPEPTRPFFLFGPFPPRFNRFDAVLNVLAYVPLGFFLALLPRRANSLQRVVFGIALGAVLSCAMETLQMFLPSRDASVVDLAANATGALGGAAIGATLARAEILKSVVANARRQLFLEDRLGDVGLALLALWVAAEMNPGIPLFAVTFDPDPARALAAVASPLQDGAALVIETAQSAFQMLGIGLFLSLLMRERRYVGGAVLVLIGCALILKGFAATLVIKPAAWESWQRPGALLGIAIGALLLPPAISLPRPGQVALCGVALLSSVLTPALTPDVLFARAPLTLFNWRYGHLLNYNGLTRTVLMVWPLFAAVWLFALAGRPGWGRPADAI